LENSSDLEEENELRCIWDAWNNIRASFGHKGGFSCLFRRLVELFYRVSWIKLMQIRKGTSRDWRERKLISKLYMDQNVQVRLDEGEFRSVKFGRGVR